MPRISNEKREKIQEQIVSLLYSTFPKQIFTVDIAKDIARDEEFVKSILLEMEKKELVVKITKNPEGIPYGRRLRWRISNKAYEIFSQLQQKKTETAEKVATETTYN